MRPEHHQGPAHEQPPVDMMERLVERSPGTAVFASGGVISQNKELVGAEGKLEERVGGLAADGRRLSPPPGWARLAPGDAALTRRVKQAGPSWAVVEKRGRKAFSRGPWAPAATIDDGAGPATASIARMCRGGPNCCVPTCWCYCACG